MTESTQKTNTSPETTTVPPKKNWTRKAICIGSAVIFVPVLGIVGALSFDAGQRALIQFADKMLDNFSVEYIEGELKHGLVLRNIHYQSEGIDTQIAQANLQLNFNCLFSREICLRDVTLSRPTIAINTALLPPTEEEQSTSKGMQRISLPIGINAENLTIQDLSLKIDQRDISLGRFQSAVSLNNERGLTVAPTEINDISVISKITKKTISKPQTEESAEPVDWAKVEQSLTPAFLGNTPEIILPFDLHIPAITGKNWQYKVLNEKGEVQQSIDISNFAIKVDTFDNQIQLQSLTIDSSLGQLSSQGKLQLNKDMAVELTLKSHLNALKSQGNEILPATDVNLNVSGFLKEKTALSLKTKGVMDAELIGDVKLAQDKMPLNITLNIRKGEYAFVNTM